MYTLSIHVGISKKPPNKMSNINEEHNFAFIFPQNSECIDILIRNENFKKSTTHKSVQF